MIKILAVASGGAVGALLRYGVFSWLGGVTDSKFPWPTFIVNCVGSFFLGLILEITSIKVISEHAKVFVTVGLLGALTTFSTFSLESVHLFRQKEHLLGIMNLFGGVSAGLVFCIAGILVGKTILRSL